MGVIDEVVAANAAYAEGFTQSGLGAPPGRRLAVLTCMDARVDPLRALGLDLGDAHVIRNAGGRASDDALRSLLLSWHALGTRSVLVVHHTRCGLHVDAVDRLRAEMDEATGRDTSAVPLLAFEDPDAALREDVERVRSSPYAPEGLEVRGFRYDVDTGRLIAVN